MKFGFLSTLLAVYWAGIGTICGFIMISGYPDNSIWITLLVSSCSIFLLYGATRLLLRENPYAWKRDRPFRLFATGEERKNGR